MFKEPALTTFKTIRIGTLLVKVFTYVLFFFDNMIMILLI